MALRVTDPPREPTDTTVVPAARAPGVSTSATAYPANTPLRLPVGQLTTLDVVERLQPLALKGSAVKVKVTEPVGVPPNLEGTTEAVKLSATSDSTGTLVPATKVRVAAPATGWLKVSADPV